MSSPILDIPFIDVNQVQKEVTANEQVVLLERASNDYASIACEDGTTVADATVIRRAVFVELVADAGEPTAPFTLELPAIKRLLVIRNSSGEQATVECVAAGPGTAVIEDGESAVIYCDGAQVFAVSGSGGGASDFTDLGDVPSSYSGEGGKLLAVNSGETAVEFVAAPYDIGTFVAGSPEADEVVLRFVATRAFTLPAGLSGSQVKAGTAADDATDFDVKKGASSVGTISFAASGDTATFTMASATSFTAGDILSIVAPSTPDATLADISFTLAGTRE